jgi:hypothetical protein
VSVGPQAGLLAAKKESGYGFETASGWGTLRKALRLINETIDVHNPDDVACVHGAPRALPCRAIATHCAWRIVTHHDEVIVTYLAWRTVTYRAWRIVTHRADTIVTHHDAHAILALLGM